VPPITVLSIKPLFDDSLTVTDANGCAMEASALINPINLHTFESISVYPNPSVGADITVHLPSDVHAGCQARLIDSKGKSVFVTTTIDG